VLLTLHGHASPVHCVAACSDGATLVSGSARGQLALWDLALVRELAESTHPAG